MIPACTFNHCRAWYVLRPKIASLFPSLPISEIAQAVEILLEIRPLWPWIVNTVAADVVMTKGAMSSTAMAQPEYSNLNTRRFTDDLLSANKYDKRYTKDIAIHVIGLSARLNVSQCWKLGQYAMPETCENWFGLVNIYVYYAHQSPAI